MVGNYTGEERRMQEGIASYVRDQERKLVEQLRQEIETLQRSGVRLCEQNDRLREALATIEQWAATGVSRKTIKEYARGKRLTGGLSNSET